MQARFLFVGVAIIFLVFAALRLFAAPMIVGQPAGIVLIFVSTACLFYGLAESRGLEVRPNSSGLILVLLSAFSATVAIDRVLLLENFEMQIGMAIAVSPFFLFACAGWWLVFRSPPNKSVELKNRLMIGLVVTLSIFFVNLFFLRLGVQ